MHLICPNCDAQYLVDDSAIPATGRDVQCSNCGHAWFHLPQAASAEPQEDEAAPPFPAEPSPAPVAPSVAANPDLLASDLPEELPGADDPSDDLPEGQGAELPDDLPPRRIDDSVLAVLREEAEREAAARRAESFPEPAVDPDPAPPAAAPGFPELPDAGDEAAARRAARLRRLDLQPDPDEPAPSRRDLLPEIEDIDATLRPAETDEDAPTVARSAASGFRNGFVLMLIVAACLVSLYAMAPRISEQFPNAAPAMTRYVEIADVARLWVDDLLRRGSDYLRQLTGG